MIQIFRKALCFNKNLLSRDNRIWVTYQNGVYDITDFVEVHPGGDKILMAAGGALEPFWSLYAVHNSSEIQEILEDMRIGKTNLML